MRPGNIVLPEGYTKEFRQAVKKNKSNAWLYRLLNDLYKAGYLQAVRDYTVKINEEIENAVNQSADFSRDVDREQFRPNGSEHGAGSGADAADTDSSEGSVEVREYKSAEELIKDLGPV